MRFQQHRSNRIAFLASLALLLASPLSAATAQLILSRDAQPPAEVKGVVDVTVVPGFDDARVTIVVDGQQIANGLRTPWHLPIDFGAEPVEHHIAVTAENGSRRVRWSTTINKGHELLTVKLAPVAGSAGVVEASVTAPESDPVMNVTFWSGGKEIAAFDAPPYQFHLPAGASAVQVTARTKSGEEAADFWSADGDVKSASVEVRTVPLYVSVIDGNGTARDDVDYALFRIVDNNTEGQILQVGKAFNQPISIALLLDASVSMSYEMPKATRAAISFVRSALKSGDRCTVFSVHSTPRREIELTSDRDAVESVIKAIAPSGHTALYDAIASAERELREEKNRRAIVLLTDGGDTSSMASFDEIDALTKETGIPIYVIAYESGDSNGDPQQDITRLQYLTGQTGGFLTTASAQNLQARYAAIEKDLRAQYSIVYQITSLARRNEWHKVHVMLKSPTLTARTIRGYFGQ